VGGRARRAIAIGAVAAAVAAVGGTALAHESPAVGDTFVGDFARHLGVAPAKVRDAYQAAVIDRIEAAVKAGRLTRAQADAIEARVRSHQSEPFGFGMPGGVHDHGPFEHRGPAPFDTAATYLGISEDELRHDVFAGSTLAKIAAAKGKTVAGLESAMLAPLRAQLAAGVKAGRLTTEQSAHILSAATARLDDFVTHGFRHEFHHEHHPPHSGQS
jgi:urease accessory protein UreF